MSLPKFTAEALIGNHESYTHAKRKYKNYDSSVKIEPAQERVEVCESRGCFPVPGTGHYACGGYVCDTYQNGRLVEYQVFRGSYHVLWNWIQSGGRPTVEQ